MTVTIDPPGQRAGLRVPPASPAARESSRWRRGASSVGWALGGAAVLVALWHLASLRSPDLPTPADTFARLREMLADPFYDRGPNDKGIGRQLLISLRRVGTGFAAATVVGVPLGLAIGASRRAFSAVNPIVSVLRPVSPLAWFPIWLTVTKDADQASVFVIF
ncbi:MAG TPA: hypothetical protein VFV35_02030, partial [Acidimicrobiales bacterium]|nr:hypothetical protein [Acidimicrobiales bacterium]